MGKKNVRSSGEPMEPVKAIRKTKINPCDYYRRARKCCDHIENIWMDIEQIRDDKKMTDKRKVSKYIARIANLEYGDLESILEEMESLDESAYDKDFSVPNWTLAQSIEEISDILKTLENVPMEITDSSEISDAFGFLEDAHMVLEQITLPYLN